MTHWHHTLGFGGAYFGNYVSHARLFGPILGIMFRMHVSLGEHSQAFIMKHLVPWTQEKKGGAEKYGSCVQNQPQGLGETDDRISARGYKTHQQASEDTIMLAQVDNDGLPPTSHSLVNPPNDEINCPVLIPSCLPLPSRADQLDGVDFILSVPLRPSDQHHLQLGPPLAIQGMRNGNNVPALINWRAVDRLQLVARHDTTHFRHRPLQQALYVYRTPSSLLPEHCPDPNPPCHPRHRTPLLRLAPRERGYDCLYPRLPFCDACCSEENLNVASASARLSLSGIEC